MPLTKEEQEQLDALTKKAEEPDPTPGNGRTVNMNVTIDLSDPEQVKRALKMGLLDKGDLDEFDETDETEETETTDDPPRRRTRYE